MIWAVQLLLLLIYREVTKLGRTNLKVQHQKRNLTHLDLELTYWNKSWKRIYHVIKKSIVSIYQTIEIYLGKIRKQRKRDLYSNYKEECEKPHLQQVLRGQKWFQTIKQQNIVDLINWITAVKWNYRNPYKAPGIV
jgi:hypothetical protein